MERNCISRHHACIGVLISGCLNSRDSFGSTVEPLNKDTFGTSRFERLSECVYTRVLLACPLLGGLFSFGVSFIGGFGRFVLFRSVLYQKFHCSFNDNIPLLFLGR